MSHRSTAVSAVMIVVASVTACSKAPPPKTPKIPVVVATARRTAVPYTIRTNGVVEPMQTAAVEAQVGGILTRVTFAEGQMVPKGYKVTEDSVHYFQIDSNGTNGTIHRRNYILRDIVVIMEVLLTPKGQNEYGSQLQAIFDSFVPPPGADKSLQDWRFGRVMKKE